MIDPYSLVLSIIAVVIAGFSLLESRKKSNSIREISELTKSIAESLEFISNRPKRKKATKDSEVAKQKLMVQQQAEERRNLKLRLQEQKHAWQKQKDVARAIGWIIDRIGEDDDYED